jgi:NADPH oxidase
MIALYSHATGCFVRDSVLPDYIPTFPFYSTEHCLGYLSWRFIIWAGILYFGERMYRIIRARRATSIEKVLLHPSGAMEVRFKKESMKYKAGQWLFLNCPEISRFQWHPVSHVDDRGSNPANDQFTISSAPEDPYISVHIRQIGDFTQALGTRLGAPEPAQQLVQPHFDEKKRDSCRSVDSISAGQGSLGRRGEFVEIAPSLGMGMPKIRVDGPYGAPAEDVFQSEVAVLVGAGIGVTVSRRLCTFDPDYERWGGYMADLISHSRVSLNISGMPNGQGLWADCAEWNSSGLVGIPVRPSSRSTRLFEGRKADE